MLMMWANSPTLKGSGDDDSGGHGSHDATLM